MATRLIDDFNQPPSRGTGITSPIDSPILNAPTVPIADDFGTGDDSFGSGLLSGGLNAPKDEGRIFDKVKEGVVDGFEKPVVDIAKADPLPDKVINAPAPPAPELFAEFGTKVDNTSALKIQEPTPAPELFAEFGTKVEEVAPVQTQAAPTVEPEPEPTPAPLEKEAPVEEEAAQFDFVNPLTGETEQFDTLEEVNKRKTDMEKKVADQKVLDEEKAANNDFLTNVEKFNADLADPSTPDAIKTAQMNELISQFGPENQAATDSMILQLKQDGLDGTGAGNAMMLLMSRGNQAQFSNMVQRLNTESSQRIYDMNKWGAEFGLKMRQDIRAAETKTFNENASLLAVAAEAGDWQNFKSVSSEMGLGNIDTDKLQQMDEFERAEFISRTLKNLGFAVEAAEEFSKITGVPLDTSHLSSLDPATQAIISDRLKAIDLIQDPEAQKQAMMKLAAEHPEAFGFPGDPEAAKDLVSQMDFANSEANQEAFSDASSTMRSLAIQDNPDMNEVILAGKGMWSAWSDSYIDTTFDNSSTASLVLQDEEQAAIIDALSGFGVESISDIDTREEKEAFLSIMKFNEMKGNTLSLSQEIFDTLSKETMGTELAEWFDGDGDVKDSTAKAWIVENIVIGGNYTRDPDTGLLSISLEDIVPPWNEDFAQYTFLTWPRKTWDEAGAETTLYSGNEFRDELTAEDAYNDPANIAEDQALTNAYLNYHKENPSGLNWLDWYDSTQGNTRPVQATEGDSFEKQSVIDRLRDTDVVLAPNERVQFIGSNLESGNLSFFDLEDQDFKALAGSEDGLAIIDGFQQEGLFDVFNTSANAFAGGEDLTYDGRTKTNMAALGLTLGEPVGNSTFLRIPFPRKADGEPQIVQIGGTRYELAFYQNQASGKVRTGSILGYPINETGNRIGDAEFVKSTTRDK